MVAFSLGEEIGMILEAVPQKACELKKLFVIPELLLLRLPEDARPAPTSRAAADVFRIDVAVAVYEHADEAAAARAWEAAVSAFARAGLDVCAATAENEAFQAPAIVLKEPSVEERYLDDDGDKENLRAAFRTTIRVDSGILGKFSRVVGRRVRYCTGRYITQPPLPFEEGALNLMLGLRPPGNHRIFSVKIRELFGRKVWSDGEERMVHGPVHWRGRLIAAEGVPIFQVIGNNYYHTVLLHSEHSNGFERIALWEKMLSMLARDLLAPPETVAPKVVAAEDGVRGMIDRRTDDLGEALRKLDFELDDLQKQFAEKLRARGDKIALIKTLRSEAAEAVGRCETDFAVMRAMEDVREVHVDPEDGLLVVTAPIALEQAGRRYDLGPFRIHIGSDGEIAVWSEEPKHPKGHAHPHVDRVSLECFGNITLSVAKLASAYRFADAVTMILRWLRSYRPETTLVPLEEFPSVPIAKPKRPVKGAALEKKDRPEPLAAAQASGPKGRASGHADRRGVDRKPRRGGARQDGRPETRRLGRR